MLPQLASSYFRGETIAAPPVAAPVRVFRTLAALDLKITLPLQYPAPGPVVYRALGVGKIGKDSEGHV